MVRYLIVLLGVATLPLTAFAQADGTLVAQEPCPAYSLTDYDAYLTGAKRRYADEVEAAKREGHVLKTPASFDSRQEFARRALDAAKVDCRRMTYLSDGLKVIAYLWAPKERPAGKLPLIIFNRGGNPKLGVLTPWHSFHRFALDGFAVLASQYRGADGGEGKDEFGGADVHDVMNLVPLAGSLDFIDTGNVFLLGWSRGGMMTALALKHGMKVRAAAVGGALTDLIEERKRRPALAARVWSELMPGYAENSDQLLRDRSAVQWAERIRVPLLILHGGADWRADPATALEFAGALQRAGATYELVIYAGDDHGISVNREESHGRIVQWFRRHIE